MPSDTKVMVSDESDVMETSQLPRKPRSSSTDDTESLQSSMSTLSPNMPSRNFGLFSARVMADKTVGELIPRSDSRSSPLVPRRRTASVPTSDPLTRRVNGEDTSDPHCRTITASFAAEARKWKLNGTLEQEFEQLKQESARDEHDFKAAKETYNQRKNRYMNVLPPEASRVRISHSGVLGSDYVNANYVDGYREKKRFIATQGPLPATVQDFWRMVWEENSGVIINTTALEEGGKLKCHKYWPEVDGTIQCGTLEVVCTSTKELGEKCVLRTLSLRNSKSNQERTVSHLSFEAWPDHGVPSSPTGILKLLQVANQQRDQSHVDGVTGPIVLHCSAGIGRTGVVCVLDTCLQRLRELNSVDVIASVLHMRRQRPGAVQTLVQYIFIYDAIAQHTLPTLPPMTSPVHLSSDAALASPLVVSERENLPLTTSEMQQLLRLGEGGPTSVRDLLDQLTMI